MYSTTPIVATSPWWLTAYLGGELENRHKYDDLPDPFDHSCRTTARITEEELLERTSDPDREEKPG